VTQGCRSMREILQPCYSAAGRTVARLRERRWWVAGFRSDSRISKQHVRILRTSLRAGPHYERRLPGDPMAMDGRSAGNAGAFSCRWPWMAGVQEMQEHFPAGWWPSWPPSQFSTSSCRNAVTRSEKYREARLHARANSRGARRATQSDTGARHACSRPGMAEFVPARGGPVAQGTSPALRAMREPRVGFLSATFLCPFKER